MASRVQPAAHPLSVRERLLLAAEELFYSQGIASTGVDAVIERAGVSTGSLYKNFGGKDALVAAYLRERDLRWRAHWETCIAECHDPVDRVLAIFTALSRWAPPTPADRGCAHLAAAVQLAEGHPAIQAALEHKDHLRRRLTELCADAGVADAEEVACDIALIYEGANNLRVIDPECDPFGHARRLARRCLG